MTIRDGGRRGRMVQRGVFAGCLVDAGNGFRCEGVFEMCEQPRTLLIVRDGGREG